MVGILMGLLMIAEILAEEFGGVEFPSGSISFADSVQEFTPGSYTEQTNTSNALGAPDYAGGEDGSRYLSLGNGGTVVLKFTDNALTASGDSDLDLWIFEVGNAVEATHVYVSQDGSAWIYVGYISGSTSGIDIDAYVADGVVVGENYLYVKLVDDEDDDYQTAAYAGADIDAVGAISTVVLNNDTCEDYDEGYEDGKQYCINNPSACGIDTNGGTSDSITINSDLSFSFDGTYSNPLTGDVDLSVDFTFFYDQNGTLLWKLENVTVQ
jgi:hypothetical protein